MSAVKPVLTAQYFLGWTDPGADREQLLGCWCPLPLDDRFRKGDGTLGSSRTQYFLSIQPKCAEAQEIGTKKKKKKKYTDNLYSNHRSETFVILCWRSTMPCPCNVIRNNMPANLLSWSCLSDAKGTQKEVKHLWRLTVISSICLLLQSTFIVSKATLGEGCTWISSVWWDEIVVKCRKCQHAFPWVRPCRLLIGNKRFSTAWQTLVV